MTSPTPFNRDISRHIWETRYRAEGETDIQATWQRVAHAIAAAEKRSSALWTERFYGLLEHFRFLPGGRILAGAGTDHRVTLFNCFVMGKIDDDLEHIFEAIYQQAHALALKGCTVFRPNAITDAILSLSLASPQVLCCSLEREADQCRES